MDQYTSDLLIKWGYSSTSVYLLNVTADVNETPLDSSFMGRLLRDLDNPSENCSPSTSIQRDSSCLAPESDNIENEESPVHFYAPYLRATEFQTKRNASGILYNAYSTRKRHLRSLGALPASKRSTSRRQSTNSDTKRTIPSGIIFEEHSTVEVAELLKNLEHPDPGPWQTIEQTWTSTLSARIHFLYQEKGTLADYLNRFPILKSPSGYHLLLQDFQKLYPEKCDGMTVFQIVPKNNRAGHIKVKQTKDIYLKRTIEDYIGSIDANKEESELNVSLLLLPFIINISPVRRKDSWKASRSEVRDGFITHVPTDREILVALAERREKLAKGVDGAFKIFHSTATEYPKESYDIWILLQLAFYDIQTDFDRPTAAVKQLMVDLHFKEKVK
ncbi:hypothetical protein EVAR_25107_1 [Eumeta japonica]|uniref:Uncharacterized protein n=1 Tax=Eumeta variegata TaxID=151549 RepID=A0A4C1ZPQ8_EUMVA|nr:hypothetical protein EVAR_25107_1 [Eumeta japonica]